MVCTYFTLIVFLRLCWSLGNNTTHKVVCFLSVANERGTEVSLFDYAHYSETLLGHVSKILLPNTPATRAGLSLSKLQKRFKHNVVFIKSDHKGIHIPSEAKKAGCDVLIIQKFGTKESYPVYPDAFNDT